MLVIKVKTTFPCWAFEEIRTIFEIFNCKWRRCNMETSSCDKWSEELKLEIQTNEFAIKSAVIWVMKFELMGKREFSSRFFFVGRSGWSEISSGRINEKQKMNKTSCICYFTIIVRVPIIKCVLYADNAQLTLLKYFKLEYRFTSRIINFCSIKKNKLEPTVATPIRTMFVKYLNSAKPSNHPLNFWIHSNHHRIFDETHLQTSAKPTQTKPTRY